MSRAAQSNRKSQRRHGVVLADDHAAFREGMARAIDAHPQLTLMAQATDGVQALAAIRDLKPAVALVDVRMPGIDGLEVCAEVARHKPSLRTRIVLLTAFPDDELARQAADAGAARFVGKDISRAKLCDALVAAADANGFTSVVNSRADDTRASASTQPRPSDAKPHERPELPKDR